MFCVAKLHTIASQHRVPSLAMFNSFIPIHIWLSLVNVKRFTHFPMNFDLALSNNTTLSQSILCGISWLCTSSATADLKLWSKRVASLCSLTLTASARLVSPMYSSSHVLHLIVYTTFCCFSLGSRSLLQYNYSSVKAGRNVLQSLLLSERLVSRDFLRDVYPVRII